MKFIFSNIYLLIQFYGVQRNSFSHKNSENISIIYLYSFDNWNKNRNKDRHIYKNSTPSPWK